MNERIRELESQCWEPRQYGPAWFDSTKFAELIVQECMNVALEQKKRVEDQEVFNSHDASWNRAKIQQSQRIVEKINEHFGVEE